jgi:V/A-type H+-transporting ATPase subunit F
MLMKYLVIGDNDTVLGFSYASVQGRVADTRDEALAALDEACKRPDIGVVIIAEDIAARIKAELDAMRRSQGRPLIVEIPGPQGPAPARRSLLSVIIEAVGIRV